MMNPDNDHVEASSAASSHSREQYEFFMEEGPKDATKSSRQQQQRGNTSFDPFNPNPVGTASLIDNEGDSDVKSFTPGIAGLLEMEPEPSRSTARVDQHQHQQTFASPYDPIRTSSGLLLTHRRTPNEFKPQQRPVRETLFQDHNDDDEKKRDHGNTSYFGRSPAVHRRPVYSSNERFEVENPWSAHHHGSTGAFLVQAKRILSAARLGVIVSAVALFLGTAVLMHSMRQETASSSASSSSSMIDANQQQQQGSQSFRVVTMGEDSGNSGTGPDRIILVPFPETTEHSQQGRQTHRVLTELRNEFESWVQHHGKVYHSQTEKDDRFNVWSENHQRTLKKNEQHGPCKLTKQPVFGSNHLKDLSHDEFKSTFLSKSTAPTADKLQDRETKAVGVLGPHIPTNHHPEVHRRISEKWNIPAAGYRSSQSCEWYDPSCFLRYIFNTYFYGFTTIMEPKYDADSYPSSVDWRDVGAVTEVHSQGNCGACWAITAVETIESAIYLNKGTLYDLSETEVIVCAEDCEMCYGGWPQDAFSYVMDSKGIPLEETLSYDGDWLLSLSKAKAGESDELNADTVSEYMASVCPQSGSHDSSSSSSITRYGNIEGYGYGTDRCVCYTDGSGCNCDSQNEGLAVRNLATYGPAVVCVDASTWQDYAGGIITSDSGCSQQFMDVNHCVQAVGYAYMDSNGNDEEDSGSGDSGSNDNGNSGSREGYWIIRNQWSSYWGMNGYAYVAMGDNTCGVLNDMIQVYA